MAGKPLLQQQLYAMKEKWTGEEYCHLCQKDFCFLTRLSPLMNSSIFRVSIFISALVTSKSLFPVSITPRSLVLYLQLPPKLQPPFPKLNIFPIQSWLSFWSSLVLSMDHHSSGITYNSCLFSRPQI